MAFNADAYVQALEPWELTIGGRTYAARPVSVPAVLRFHEQVKKGGLNNGHASDLVRDLLRSAFPWRPHYVWRDPVKQVLALDPDAQQAVLEDFFGYLDRWSEKRRGMRGTTSRRKTPPQSPAGSEAAPPSP